MAGIYIHIPFCGHACTYCDFHFTTHLNFKEKFLETLYSEIELRSSFLSGEKLDTIYFGGGTPSQLKIVEIEGILNAIKKNLNVVEGAEVTLECNPDDIYEDYAAKLISIGINRLSMGIQSFHNVELKLLGRKHTAEKAIQAVEIIKHAGFKNFSLDLIYGVPNSTLDSWNENLKTILKLNPSHISAYCLTIEKGTQLEYQIRKGRLIYPEEELIISQFKSMMKMLTDQGYDHYEISNFSRLGFESKHNTSYWKGTNYLGLGPSAHSFDGECRYINVADTRKYCENLGVSSWVETEQLTSIDKYNEYIMTRLRTKWGIDMDYLALKFPATYKSKFEIEVKEPIEKGFLKLNKNSIVLTQNGKLIADKLASDLFIID